MKAKQFEDDSAVKVHRIRITLTSRNVKNLEKGAQLGTAAPGTALRQPASPLQPTRIRASPQTAPPSLRRPDQGR